MNTFVVGFEDKSTSDAVEGRHSQALLTTRVGEWIYQNSTSLNASECLNEEVTWALPLNLLILVWIKIVSSARCGGAHL